MPPALWLPLCTRPSPAYHTNRGQVPPILQNVAPGQCPQKESLTQKGKGCRREHHPQVTLLSCIPSLLPDRVKSVMHPREGQGRRAGNVAPLVPGLEEPKSLQPCWGCGASPGFLS